MIISRSLNTTTTALRPTTSEFTPTSPHKAKLDGFTLAELLIALAILAEIAAFTIPKILTAQQNAQRVTVFKETIAALSQITYMGYMTGELTTSNVTSYYGSKLNAVKVCPTNSNSEGCWPSGTEGDEPGFVLHNGAMLSGFNNSGPGNGIFMDWNGANPPNLEGEDIMQLQVCFGSPCWFDARAGTVMTYSATSATMYQEIFTN